MQDLLKQIELKKKELAELQKRYDIATLKEKENILKSKSKGISKSLYLLSFEFRSSCERTPQYIEFHKTFKKELTNLLKPYCDKIEVSKPNHFDVTGFFQMKNGQVFYFSLGDLRWDKQSILLRTAKNFKDYTGGSNEGIKLDENFANNLLRRINEEVK